ncbi:unnamed protein product [Fusarium venenatum]|uniref:RNase H type-1 domain-containing protein n=1 Tax=Fusarium venenatum TaxID=56646 RepID=A0A2L2TIN9_9HYPO|nr:LOW QUALITY PROTEIN: uncharacterized protein FVRRES_12888 [Fusarium venenatum]CEI40197.1 unnamed protein product [Fusarium venenatum]
MCRLPDSITKLYIGVQDFLNRSQRSWQAACAAWNEVPEAPTMILSAQTPKIDIDIGHKLPAIRGALSALDAPPSDSRLVFWTDASKKHRSAGWAAVFREGCTLVRIMARGPCGTSSNIEELQAIGLALDYTIQLEEENDKRGRLQILEVYIDSQATLELLRKALSDLPPLGIDDIDDTKCKYYNNKKRAWLLAQMIAREVGRKATQLQEAGVYIELNWVPRDTVIGNQLADRGAALARMGVGCGYTLNNALVEFLPADPVGEGDEDKTSVCLTVPQIRMAEEIESTLIERAAEVEDILAATTQDVVEEPLTEATWQRIAEPEPEPETDEATADETVGATGEETVEVTGQRPEIGNNWHNNDAMPIDPQLYLPLPDEMTGVATRKVAAEEAN